MSMRVWVAAAAAALVCASAMAHVTVWPRESRVGAYEKYVVRVPTEGKTATTAVEVVVPENVSVVSVAAPTGYSYELKRTGERITSIVFTMQIKPGEFAEFAFMARNPKEAGDVVWKAVQRFADGTSEEWTGPSGDKHPASITKVKPG
jgi:uncharacterized protein YcnI